ncbi:hypothetical protein Q9X95_004568 [Vibrio parahaemolyticus]|uniref:hypothetical protein n=1 Tax=Vibrio parahaemolyticus TaxID=670 RepID=UPI0007A0B5A9|nr:hypothetical protein [Vibrio parahaemolyticus]EGQ7678935.1 hypothetical protein [Vibrio parahaemolyticus]EGQ9221831.1 hypothetical protein [Vibrio parahaemolyticus]ELA7275982.1 hypothetical protein [Vibrio parahaemolyticus]ELA7280943.1 hypothetical protein [Vibrio parahaemolyticus]ELA7343333.1 hypothetical protein [Vibrio parahaemolyticus]
MSDEIAKLEDSINKKLSEINDTTVQVTPEVNTHLQTAYLDSFWLSCILLVFGFVLVLLLTYLIKAGKDPEQLLRSFGTILIIIAAVFLIVAGYSEKQIAPVIGLLGTIAGYLLGKSSKKRET